MPNALPKDAAIDQVYGPFRPARQIMLSICLGTGVTPEDVIGRSRSSAIIMVRRRVAQTIYNELHWSYPKIGKFLHKDHSTIWHAVHMPAGPLPQLEPEPVVEEPTPDKVGPMVRRFRDEKIPQMRTEERRQLARLLYVHGPHCYERFEVNLRPSRMRMHHPPFEEICK
jgi:hypothetical protein